MNESRPLIPVHDESHDHHAMEETVSEKEYGKLALVFVAIIAITFVLNLAIDGHGTFNNINPVHAVVAQFMGVFFIVFASFKLVNIKEFVNGFRMYDRCSQRWPRYAYFYPFLQLAIGISMFIRPDDALVQMIALVVSASALYGAFTAVMDKKKIQCACLGNVIKMPLTTVTIVEDGLMCVLAIYMIVAIAIAM